MTAQLILAQTPVFKNNYARIACYRKFLTPSGCVKKPDVRITGFAYGRTYESIKEAAKAGLLRKGTAVVAELKKAMTKLPTLLTPLPCLCSIGGLRPASLHGSSLGSLQQPKVMPTDDLRQGGGCDLLGLASFHGEIIPVQKVEA